MNSRDPIWQLVVDSVVLRLDPHPDRARRPSAAALEASVPALARAAGPTPRPRLHPRTPPRPAHHGRCGACPPRANLTPPTRHTDTRIRARPRRGMTLARPGVPLIPPPPPTLSSLLLCGDTMACVIGGPVLLTRLGAWWGVARSRARGVGRLGRRASRYPSPLSAAALVFFFLKGGYWEGLLGHVLLLSTLPSFPSLSPLALFSEGGGGEPDACRQPAWPRRPTRPVASDRRVGRTVPARRVSNGPPFGAAADGGRRALPQRARTPSSLPHQPPPAATAGVGDDGAGQRRGQREAAAVDRAAGEFPPVARRWRRSATAAAVPLAATFWRGDGGGCGRRRLAVADAYRSRPLLSPV